MKEKSKITIFKLVTSLAFLSGLGAGYADDARSYCQKINDVAARGTPNFLASNSIGCDALPQDTKLSNFCHNEQPEPYPPYPNCSVTHYGWDGLSSPPDNVIECSVNGEVRFKYVLCGYKDHYKWGLMLKNTNQDIPNSIDQD